MQDCAGSLGPHIVRAVDLEIQSASSVLVVFLSLSWDPNFTALSARASDTP